MRSTLFHVLPIAAALDNLLSSFCHVLFSLLYFFLFAMVFAGPFLVLALVLVL